MDGKHSILKDNFRIEADEKNFENSVIQYLQNKTMGDLTRSDMLIFPGNDDSYMNDDRKVLETAQDKVMTTNLLGFFSSGKDTLSIVSGFDNGEDNYFLQYNMKFTWRFFCPKVAKLIIKSTVTRLS